MIFDYFVLAWKSLSNKKMRSWLTVVGILIGVVAVVSLISLGEGLKAAVNSQFGVSSTEIISVQAGGLTGYGPPGTGVTDPLTKDDAEAIEKLSTVERVINRNVRSGKAEFNDIAAFGYAINIPKGEDRKFVYETVEVEAQIGRLLKAGDVNKVALGYNFLEDEIFGKSVMPGNTIIIQGKKFEVVGVAKKKGSFIFDNIIYMDEDEMEELMDYGDVVDVLAVQIKDPSLMDKAREDIEKLLRKRRGVKEGEENFEVSTPQQSLETVNQVITGVQIFIVIIAFISIVVGAIGIVNTMTTSVMERKKQIGIMKAIGAKNIDIFMQFFVESGMMGLIGGIVGSVIGIMIGYMGTVGLNTFLGTETQPTINFTLIFLTLFGSFMIGSAAGIIPAMAAARQKPVDALRK